MNQPEPRSLRRQWRQDRKRHIALACGVVAAVTLLSFLPEDDKMVLHTKGRFHGWGHMLAFGVVAYLASRTSRSLGGRTLIFFAALIFGLLIEAGEGVIFHGTLEWTDVVADSLGVVIGTVIALLSARLLD